MRLNTFPKQINNERRPIVKSYSVKKIITGPTNVSQAAEL